MPLDRARLEEALRNADAAGDIPAAQMIAAELRKASQFVGPTEEQAGPGVKPAKPISRTEAALRAFTTGAWMGAGPTVAASMRMAEDRDAPFSQQTMDPTIYSSQLAHERGRLKAGREQYPITSTVAELGGAVTTGVGIPGARTVLGTGAQGFGIGGLYGYNASEAPTLGGQAKDAAIGAGVGGAAGLVGGAIASRLSRGKAPKAPTIDEIELAKDAAYKAADATNEVVPLDRIRALIPKVQGILRERGFRPAANPMANDALQALKDEVADPSIYGQTLKGVESLRRQIMNDVQAAGNNRADAAMARAVLDSFDEFMEELLPYGDARKLFHTLMKAQDIEALFEKAANNAGGHNQAGFETALYHQFKSLANNARRFNRFNEAEKAAILEVVRPGGLQNLLRFFGKGAVRGPVSAMATGLLGDAIAGPAGAIALGAVGEGSRAIAGGMRTGAANRVSELIRSGAPIARPQAAAQYLPSTGYLPAASGPLVRNALAPEDERTRNALAR